jgi:hypothetical protein
LIAEKATANVDVTNWLATRRELLISNVISKHGLPDHGTRLLLLTSPLVLCEFFDLQKAAHDDHVIVQSHLRQHRRTVWGIKRGRIRPQAARSVGGPPLKRF